MLEERDMETIKDSNVLVIGGAGFIGSNLVKELAKMHLNKLVVLDNMALKKYTGQQRGLDVLKTIPPGSFKFIVGDASDYKFMRELMTNENFDIVFNLAVLCLPLALKEPKVVFDNNVKVASTLCELLREDRFNILIHFSSSEVYGSAIYVPMDEDHPLRPSTSYGASKAAQDLIALSYYQTYDVDVRIIRPFNNVGAGQNDASYSAVVPRTVRRILNGMLPEIFGDGLQTRDFIYVVDTCHAAIKMATRGNLKGEVINIGSGKETRIVDLVTKICNIMGYQGKVVFKPPRPGDVRRHYANINKAKILLNFTPQTQLDDALKICIDWYSKIHRAKNGV